MVRLLTSAKDNKITDKVSFEGNKIKVVHIVNISEKDTHFIAAIQTKLDTRLKEFKKVFPIDSVSVLPYELAKQLFTWVI